MAFDVKIMKALSMADKCELLWSHVPAQFSFDISREAQREVLSAAILKFTDSRESIVHFTELRAALKRASRS